MPEWIVNLSNSLNFVFERLDWLDLVDLALVTLIFFVILLLLRDTQAAFLLRGAFLLIILISLLTTLEVLPAFSWLVSNTLPALLLAIRVIFAPEVRRTLERLGRAGSLVPADRNAAETLDVVTSVVSAAARLSRTRRSRENRRRSIAPAAESACGRRPLRPILFAPRRMAHRRKRTIRPKARLEIENGVLRRIDDAPASSSAAVEPLPDSVHDFAECTVLPGLVDSHVHLSMTGPMEEARRTRLRQAPAEVVFQTIPENLREHLRCGVVAVRDGGGARGNALRFAKGPGRRTDPAIRIFAAGRGWHRCSVPRRHRAPPGRRRSALRK